MTMIPDSYIAAVAQHVGDLPTLTELPTPNAGTLKPNTALVNILFSGVCHSDVVLSLGKGTHRPVEPVISGHEGVGVVVAVGPAVNSTPPLKIGARVGVKFVFDTCGMCEACLDGDEDSCHNKQIASITTQGTFQQFIVAPVHQLIHIPDEVPSAQAAPILCAGITTYKALLKAEVKIGDWVVVPGAGGGLGHLAVQYALAMNARVIAIDTGEDKRALMERYGVQAWIDFRQEVDVVRAVQRIVGHGEVKAAIVTAGVIGPYQQALEYCGSRSTLVCVGLPVGQTISVDPSKMVVQNSRIVGSSTGSRAEVNAAMALVAMGKVKVELQVRAFHEIRDVYHELEAGKVGGFASSYNCDDHADDQGQR